MEDYLLLFFWCVQTDKELAQLLLTDIIEEGLWIPFSLAVLSITRLAKKVQMTPYFYLYLYRLSYIYEYEKIT